MYSYNKIAALVVAFVTPLVAVAQFADPFSVSADISTEQGKQVLSVSFSVPEQHYLYADQLSIVFDDVSLKVVSAPEKKEKHDQFTDSLVSVYDKDAVFRYTVADAGKEVAVTVNYQGCNESLCFMPQTKKLITGEGEVVSSTAGASETGGRSLVKIVAGYQVIGKASGYLKPKEFLSFLNGTQAQQGEATTDIGEAFESNGIWLTVLLILLGGLALNLTPCVLPMIPINIAIIGAGAQASSKGKGFLLGAVYGAGIAAVYGILGLTVVLTGAKFGALNSSLWFNVAIAVLFTLMSLAMFDVFSVDFSRFAGNAGTGSKGKLLTAFLLGGVAALLAGACVAPVVISVLLLSANLYAQDHAAALALPFLLGAGMALPWPFAGAGLSFLPKPGKWMEKIKYGFGVIILGMAVWYGVQSYKIFFSRGEKTSFYKQLLVAEKTGKPVFIDFWASWCKNCSKMEKTTFLDEAVVEKMESFTEIKYQAEDLNDEEVKAVLDHFGVIGLPTYVIMAPTAPTTGQRD